MLKKTKKIIIFTLRNLSIYSLVIDDVPIVQVDKANSLVLSLTRNSNRLNTLKLFVTKLVKSLVSSLESVATEAQILSFCSTVHSCRLISSTATFFRLLVTVFTQMCYFTGKTRVTRRRVPCKRRQICRSSLMIIALQKTKIVQKSQVSALALAVSEIINLKMIDPKKQVNVVRCKSPKWYHSLANIQIYERRSVHFCGTSYRFRDINILIF